MSYTSTCFFCHLPIKETEPSVSFWQGRDKFYRHIRCIAEWVQEPLDYVPFGEVTDEDLYKEE